jgi:hypothetical protein
VTVTLLTTPVLNQGLSEIGQSQYDAVRGQHRDTPARLLLRDHLAKEPICHWMRCGALLWRRQRSILPSDRELPDHGFVQRKRQSQWLESTLSSSSV